MVLSYCTNVHPARGGAELFHSLERYAVPLARRLAVDHPGLRPGAGLWLPERVIADLRREAGAIPRLRRLLDEGGLSLQTVNAFPAGDFHAPRVKENVFRPTWLEEERLEFTLRAAELLAVLLPAGATGSLSTLPGSFKPWGNAAEDHRAIARRMARAAEALARLSERTGRTLLLAVEPEPHCTLENTEEMEAFFGESLPGAGSAEAVRRHVGVCLDTCHLSVQFERPVEALARFRSKGIPVFKIQISSALEAAGPELSRLRPYDEPRYLHQATALFACGGRLRAADLGGVWDDPRWTKAPRVRTHFHVPVFWPGDGGLRTTQAEVEELLGALDEPVPHLEIETYTWGVLPEPPRTDEDWINGLAREFEWVARRLPSGILSP